MRYWETPSHTSYLYRQRSEILALPTVHRSTQQDLVVTSSIDDTRAQPDVSQTRPY